MLLQTAVGTSRRIARAEEQVRAAGVGAERGREQARQLRVAQARHASARIRRHRRERSLRSAATEREQAELRHAKHRRGRSSRSNWQLKSGATL
eukprot:2599220-Pleurochrysis_carterae.AAC.2